MLRKWHAAALLLALIGACDRENHEASRATPVAPDVSQMEYAVYVVAIESLVVRPNALRDLIVISPTVGDGPEGPAAVEAMRDDADIPEDVRADFMTKNRVRVALHAERLPLTIPVRVLPRDSVAVFEARSDADGKLGSTPRGGRHVVHVSRVGFSRDSSRAVLYLGNSCGDLCGTGWKVQLRRDTGYAWRIVAADVVWMS
jgi:hypothetical protein